VVFFPEGTSTDGTTLLPFHSFLFEPAVLAEAMVTASALRYQAQDAEESDLCYYGDIHFAPHLLKTMGRKEVRGKIRFDARPRTYYSRKQAANDTWERVARLRLRADLDSFDTTPFPMASADRQR
jgi:1-acyl-sn-glycerol-3-phosphate acyltransferase